MEALVQGIDGCRKGWLVIQLAADDQWHAAVYATFAEVMHNCPLSVYTLVDMPVGLPGQQLARGCDHLARRCLTRKRGASVFPVPSRAALQVEDYRTACDINAEILGVRISRQAWNLRSRILDLDQWIQTQDPQQQRVRESYPELAFWSLAGKCPMQYAKKTPAGATERLALLQGRFSETEELYHEINQKYSRKILAPDDILDALVLALMARDATLKTLSDYPTYDEKGLRMEIVYGEWNTMKTETYHS